MKRPFVVFDIDGTYFRSHLYWEMSLALARENKLHPDVNELALSLYDSWKKRAHATAFEDFDHQTVTKINEMVKEIDPAVYDSMLHDVMTPLLDHVYMFPAQLKKQLQDKGYVVLAISGSRIQEVELFAKHHGFDDWVGQIWHRTADGKHFTGEITPTYKDKHLLLEKFVQKHKLTYENSYGVGDTAGDISLLEKVANPIAFNPNHTLLAHAKSAKWKIVVERKSIAYTLEPRDGSYILA